MKPTASVILGLGALVHGHFVLQAPTSIGFNDAKEIEGPCSGFDAKDPSKGVTDWPVDGLWVSVLSTHNDVTWEINAGLVGDGEVQFSPLVQPFKQDGVGSVCFEVVPGNPNWIGKDAVVQVIQHAVDGELHQCAAVRFVSGGPASPDSSCINSPNVVIDPIIGVVKPEEPKPTDNGSGTSSSPDTTGRVPTSGPSPGQPTHSHDHNDDTQTSGHSSHTSKPMASTSQPPVVTAGSDHIMVSFAGILVGLGAMVML